jgi:DNA modification methylase
MNDTKVLDNTSKEDLLSRLAGFSSSNNKALYEFALMLHEETKDIDWTDSGGKMNFLNELVKRPDIYVNDAGALRQVIVAGRLIANVYKDDLDYISKMGYWNFVAIARARLSNDDEENISKKKKLINSVIEGSLTEGKIKKEINKVKDREFPKELDGLLEIYNVWNISKLDQRFGIEHPGQIPGQIIVNVIYHYLPKTAVIVDPMAGGGTTHDVCEFLNSVGEDEAQLSMFPEERYNLTCYSFDLNPRRDFVVKKNSLEDDWGVDRVDLVFLDPPYFSMKKDDYVDNDFTASREAFYNAVDLMSKKAYGALKSGGICAIIIQPQTEKDLMEGEVCIDLPFECYKIMEKYFKPFQRIQTPLSTQQFSAIDVNRVMMKDNRHRLLGVSRDLILMKK